MLNLPTQAIDSSTLLKLIVPNVAPIIPIDFAVACQSFSPCAAPSCPIQIETFLPFKVVRSGKVVRSVIELKSGL